MRWVALLGLLLASGSTARSAEARPVGGFGAAGHVGAGPADGAIFGVDGTWGALVGQGSAPSESGWGVGVRGGYAFASGLELHLRYDDLGAAPTAARPPIQLGTAGLRYTVPILFPMPFAEIDAGPAWLPEGVVFGASGALGLTFPVVNHVLIDLAGSDWLLPLGGELRQTLTVGLGLAITFGGPR